MSEVKASPFFKCPSCPCVFCSEADLILHQRVCRELRDERMGWRKGEFGEEICPSSGDVELVGLIRRNGGRVSMGRFDIRLSKNGRWLVRKEIMFR